MSLKQISKQIEQILDQNPDTSIILRKIDGKLSFTVDFGNDDQPKPTKSDETHENEFEGDSLPFPKVTKDELNRELDEINDARLKFHQTLNMLDEIGVCSCHKCECHDWRVVNE